VIHTMYKRDAEAADCGCNTTSIDSKSHAYLSTLALDNVAEV